MTRSLKTTAASCYSLAGLSNAASDLCTWLTRVDAADAGTNIAAW